MTQIISFPGLGFSFSVSPDAFSIGGLTVKWYGVIFACAFLLGTLYVLRRTKKFGLDSDRVMDVLLGAIVCGVIGARIYYVAFSWDMYKDNLIDVFKVWNGGIGIYGGIIGAVLGGWALCKWRKVRFLPMLDLCSAGLILAQAIGRWGNFVNAEAFGSATTAPWRMTSEYAGGVGSTQIQRYLAALTSAEIDAMGGIDAIGVHPTFFYESLWCLLGFFLLMWMTKRRKFDGQMILVYTMWYGAERFIVEGLRTDSLMIGNLRVSQVLGIVSAIAALVVMLVVLQKKKASNDPEYLQLYVDTQEAQLIREGKFYEKKPAVPVEDPVEEDGIVKEEPEAKPEAEQESALAVEEDPQQGQERLEQETAKEEPTEE
ncbi:MAG: prolipoprotein diacylglyceryl transferase [Oscillospiraceae bacterium]|nr:prolipoprotein diacylglyceryl transferase [Oscillospiraceae bacterium]